MYYEDETYPHHALRMPLHIRLLPRQDRLIRLDLFVEQFLVRSELDEFFILFFFFGFVVVIIIGILFALSH